MDIVRLTMFQLPKITKKYQKFKKRVTACLPKMCPSFLKLCPGFPLLSQFSEFISRFPKHVSWFSEIVSWFPENMTWFPKIYDNIWPGFLKMCLEFPQNVPVSKNVFLNFSWKCVLVSWIMSGFPKKVSLFLKIWVPLSWKK